MRNIRKTIRRITNRKQIIETMNEAKAELDRRTAGYAGESIWDLQEFLTLVDMAEYMEWGRSNAVVYAYKLGWLAGKGDRKNGR